MTDTFENIDQGLQPTDFAQFNDAVAKAKPGTSIPIDVSQPKPTGYLHGNVTFRLKGTLDVDHAGKWRFTGDVGAKNDVYDFDKRRKGAERPFPAEQMTTIARELLQGKPYPVHFVGKRSVEASGRR